MLISLIVLIISKCIHIINHQVVDLQYTIFLIVNYTSAKLEVGKENKMRK